MVELVATVVITFVILVGLGSGLNSLWNAGYWPLVVGFTPALFAVVYFFSPQNERDEFRANLWAIITARTPRRRLRLLVLMLRKRFR